MNNSSPARSYLSTTATGGGGGGGNGGCNSNSIAFPVVEELRFPDDLDFESVQDQKEEALAVLKMDLKAHLNKVVKSMDEDSWMFEGPRSRIRLTSRPGTFIQKHIESNTKPPNLMPSQSR